MLKRFNQIKVAGGDAKINKVLKHIGVFAFVLIVLSLLFVALPIGIAYAAQLFEHYNDVTSSGAMIHTTRWVAQTFTAESAHSVTSIRLPLRREGDPGMVTVSIRGTDESGHPYGTDLASETIAGSTLPAFLGPWPEIFFTTPCDLTEGQKYAIVVSAPSGDGTYTCAVWYYGKEGTYDGGNAEGSWGGTNWTSYLTWDLQFEVYGEETLTPAPTPVGGEVYPVNRIVLVVPWIILAAAIIAGGVFLISRKAYR